MGIYRVIVNGKDTGEYVTASSVQEAYADVSASMLLKYSDDVQLQEIASSFDIAAPIGNNTIHESTESVLEQELFLDKDG